MVLSDDEPRKIRMRIYNALSDKERKVLKSPFCVALGMIRTH